MGAVFLKLLNMSITAGWLILAVIFLRLVLRRAPRWLICLLWGMVAVRLICPVSFQSIFSLIPSRETVRQEIVFSESPAIQSGIRLVDHVVNPVLQDSFAPEPGASVNPLQVWLFAAGMIWLLGVGLMLGYVAVSYMRLHLRLRTAVRLEGSVYFSEFVDTPFIFGVLRPRIYLPSGMPETLREPVIAHEKAHLARRDYLWKILAYFLLTVYWFHPLCWAAYVLFCRDMELACDEKVIRSYDGARKRVYSEALLECSMKGRRVWGCPLAFGEVGVKTRIRSVMNYKKPAFWMMAAAVAACILLAVCFLTDPAKKAGSGENEESNLQEVAGNVGADDSGADEADRGTPGNGSQEGNGGAAQAQEPLENNREENTLQAFIGEWTKAFVGRDADGIAALCKEELLSELALPEYASMPEGVWQQIQDKFHGLLRQQDNGRYSFGESEAWPRDPEADVVIRTMEEGRAEIIYYAWTEEPRVTVWKENLSYEPDDRGYAVTAEELIFYDNISSERDFAEAYDIYSDFIGYYNMAVDGSRIDYSSNGAGEELGRRALLSSSMKYRPLFEDPEKAAIMLLNLAEDSVEIKVLDSHRYGAASRLGLEEGAGSGAAGDAIADLSITFPREDGVPVRISMVQYGSSGIWLPVSYRPNPFYRLLEMDWEEISAKNLSVKDDPDWQDIVCLGEIPEQKIKLYGYNDAECGGEGVAIEIGDDVNYFDWIYTSPRCLLPECYWNEGKKQLQVALNIYTGTGADAQELHVLQQYATGTLQDFALDLNGYEELLQQRITYTFDEEAGRLTLYDRQNGALLSAADLLLNWDDSGSIVFELGEIRAGSTFR